MRHFFCVRLKRPPAGIILPRKLPPGRRLMNPAGGRNLRIRKCWWRLLIISRLDLSLSIMIISTSFSCSPDYTRRGIGHALIGGGCASLPGKILSVDASITARSSFLRQGFRVVAEQRVESRGERFHQLSNGKNAVRVRLNRYCYRFATFFGPGKNTCFCVNSEHIALPIFLLRYGSHGAGSAQTVGRIRRSRHPAQKRRLIRGYCPAALRLRGTTDPVQWVAQSHR